MVRLRGDVVAVGLVDKHQVGQIDLSIPPSHQPIHSASSTDSQPFPMMNSMLETKRQWYGKLMRMTLGLGRGGYPIWI